MQLQRSISRGLFYCQYLVGIGHLVRSLHICRSLIKKYDVDFLLGGHEFDLCIESRRFHPLFLPPLAQEDFSVGTLDKQQAMQDKFAQRREFINHLDQSYAFLITKLFPFSKWQLKEEIEALIHKVKTINPQCLIACSLRDSFTQNNPERDGEILDFVARFYNYIFVHSDPRVFKIEESFRLTQKLRDKIIYTGFITHPETKLHQGARQQRIVVSLGSGAFGSELMEAVMRVASAFPGYQFVFILGPKSPSSLVDRLITLAHQNRISNVHFQPFLRNFPEYLSQSALSISLGGYTIIDAVYTKTPAIVYPSTFYDQYVRGLKFAAFGYIKLITADDLNPSALRSAIQKALEMPSVAFDIDMFGAQNTCREIDRLIQI